MKLSIGPVPLRLNDGRKETFKGTHSQLMVDPIAAREEQQKRDSNIEEV